MFQANRCCQLWIPCRSIEAAMKPPTVRHHGAFSFNVNHNSSGTFRYELHLTPAPEQANLSDLPNAEMASPRIEELEQWEQNRERPQSGQSTPSVEKPSESSFRASSLAARSSRKAPQALNVEPQVLQPVEGAQSVHSTPSLSPAGGRQLGVKSSASEQRAIPHARYPGHSTDKKQSADSTLDQSLPPSSASLYQHALQALRPGIRTPSIHKSSSPIPAQASQPIGGPQPARSPPSSTLARSRESMVDNSESLKAANSPGRSPEPGGSNSQATGSTFNQTSPLATTSPSQHHLQTPEPVSKAPSVDEPLPPTPFDNPPDEQALDASNVQRGNSSREMKQRKDFHHIWQFCPRWFHRWSIVATFEFRVRIKERRRKAHHPRAEIQGRRGRREHQQGSPHSEG